MSNPMIDVPFVWPDSRKLAGYSGPAPDLCPLSDVNKQANSTEE